MTVQENQIEDFMAALSNIHSLCSTVDQLARLIAAIRGKQGKWALEIQKREQAEINRRALTGFSWRTV